VGGERAFYEKGRSVGGCIGSGKVRFESGEGGGGLSLAIERWKGENPRVRIRGQTTIGVRKEMTRSRREGQGPG